MDKTSWYIIDTETTGLRSPIFVVELGAQRMRGWEPDGPPFRRLINHGTNIPPEASRVHGYTREILERDGYDPETVYREFSEYTGNHPVSAYNLKYDWDDVLIPEWSRLRLAPIGVRGFCIYELAKRLLDPVPAGNCKLQTLRQYYELPSRGAHSALGDVETAVDLLQRVLRPICEARGLQTFQDVCSFSADTWYPSRIPFGKYKGRHFQDALTDEDFRSWLLWLSESENPRSKEVGQWYLDRLNQPLSTDWVTTSTASSLAIYTNPDLARLKQLIGEAQTRLAELEAGYTSMRQSVSVTQARLFKALHKEYLSRDLLSSRLSFRRQYLEALLNEGEKEAQSYQAQGDAEDERIHSEYQRTTLEAEGKKEHSKEEEQEIKKLWRKLIQLFHPDRFVADAKKQAVYQKLTTEINLARDTGDINKLREIAQDPERFILTQGWGEFVLAKNEGIEALERLYESLQGMILELIEAIEIFHQSPEFELYNAIKEEPALFDSTMEQYRSEILKEVADLEQELSKVEADINMLQA